MDNPRDDLGGHDVDGTGARIVRLDEFRQWLKAWRHRHRMSQSALAEGLGYDVTYVAKIEGGTRPPSRQFLARLAEVAGEPQVAAFNISSEDVSRPPLPSAGPLVGREREVDDLVALLSASARCVTLVGPPGIGKTTLAKEVAARLDRVFARGSWWVSLLDVDSAADVAHRIRQDLGLPARGNDPVDVLIARLRNQRTLLVLDNFEHVLPARSSISRLIEHAPGVALLVTSRERLGLVSEHVYPVGPLSSPDVSRTPSLDEIRTTSAVQLFTARAAMADPTFQLTTDNCDAVARTCVHLDGIPLAIVLAAGGIGTEGVAGVERRAERHFEAAAAPVDLPADHQTLHAAIGRSWRLLSVDEARMFASLGVFRGGCTAAAAAAITEHAPGLLDALWRKSLVEARPDTPVGPRFEMLETIRSFARMRLAESGELPVAQQRHAEYFTTLAETHGRGLLGADQVQSVEAFTVELDNLRDAFDWSLGNRPDLAIRLASSSWRYFLMRDIPTGRRWLNLALDASPAASLPRAAALAGAGALDWVTGHRAMAEAHLAEALALGDELGADDVAAVAWLNRGALTEQLGELDAADDCFENALRLYERIDDLRGRACALVGLGMIRRRRGEVPAACGHWTEAVRLFRIVGDRFNQTLAFGNLAWAAEFEERFDEAQDWLEQCRKVQIALGDARGLGSTTVGLARLALKQHVLDSAERLATDALGRFQLLDDRPWAASTLVVLGAVAARDGRWRRALQLVGAADALWQQMGASPRDDDETLRDEVVAACRRHLNAGETARAVANGRSMTLDDAVEVVRG